MIVKLGNNIPVKIYELRDPRDASKSPRYIGITTKSLKKRLAEHLILRKDRYISTYKYNWINKLLQEGVKPTIHLIEEVIGWDYACEVEKYWIKEFKDQGYKLTNSTEGGEGIVGLKMSFNTIQKINKTKLVSIQKNEKNINHGISKNTITGKWEAYIWINNIKVSLRTYHNKKDALKIRKHIINLKHINPGISIEEVKIIVKDYYIKEWCNNLLKKPPQVCFVSKTQKWKATTFCMGGKVKFLGEFKDKNDAILAYYKGVKDNIIETMSKRKFSNQNIK